MENEVNKLIIVLELLFSFFIFLFFKKVQNYFSFLLLLHMNSNIKYSI